MEDKKQIVDEISKNWKEQHFSTQQRDLFIDLLLKERPSYCLETGFCTGTSSATILATCKPLNMISIGMEYNSLEIADTLEDQYNFRLVVGDSTRVMTGEFFDTHFPSGVDFYHVDGGHTYPVVESDLEKGLPHMNSNSIIVVDDYGSKLCPLPSVDAAVDAFVEKHSLSLERVSTPEGKGMVIIRL